MTVGAPLLVIIMKVNIISIIFGLFCNFYFTSATDFFGFRNVLANSGNNIFNAANTNDGDGSRSSEVDKLKKELEMERIKRHVEIRRELEKDATPFLEDGRMKLNLNVANAANILDSVNSKPLKSIPTSWMDFMSTFSLIDLVMGIFSVMALGFGSVYVIWRINPLASKVEK